MPPYATARQRVDAVGGNTLLLRWVVEGGTSTAVALAVAGAPGAEVVSAATVSLGVLPLVCPRRLLDAVPDVAAVLVRAAHRLTEPTVEINEAVVGLLTCLLIALKMVGLVDPPTLRRLPGVAGTLASVYATLPSGGAAGRGAAGAATTLHEVFKILAAAPEALAASPGGLALLVKWARQTGTPHQQWLADTAVAISLFVGVYHLLAAGAGVDGAPTTLPSTLRRAGATWAHVAITHPSRKAAAAGRLLALLATHGAGMVGEVLADAPWAGDFPNPALSIFGDDANGHCWACGAPRRADAPPDTAGDSLGPSLRSCAGCRVAAYCSAACATAGWRTAGGGAQGGVPPVGGLPESDGAGTGRRPGSVADPRRGGVHPRGALPHHQHSPRGVFGAPRLVAVALWRGGADRGGGPAPGRHGGHCRPGVLVHRHGARPRVCALAVGGGGRGLGGAARRPWRAGAAGDYARAPADGAGVRLFNGRRQHPAVPVR